MVDDLEVIAVAVVFMSLIDLEEAVLWVAFELDGIAYFHLNSVVVGDAYNITGWDELSRTEYVLFCFWFSASQMASIALS